MERKEREKRMKFEAEDGFRIELDKLVDKDGTRKNDKCRVLESEEEGSSRERREVRNFGGVDTRRERIEFGDDEGRKQVEKGTDSRVKTSRVQDVRAEVGECTKRGFGEVEVELDNLAIDA